MTGDCGRFFPILKQRKLQRWARKRSRQMRMFWESSRYVEVDGLPVLERTGGAYRRKKAAL